MRSAARQPTRRGASPRSERTVQSLGSVTFVVVDGAARDRRASWPRSVGTRAYSGDPVRALPAGGRRARAGGLRARVRRLAGARDLQLAVAPGRLVARVARRAAPGSRTRSTRRRGGARRRARRDARRPPRRARPAARGDRRVRAAGAGARRRPAAGSPPRRRRSTSAGSSPTSRRPAGGASPRSSPNGLSSREHDVRPEMKEEAIDALEKVRSTSCAAAKAEPSGQPPRGAARARRRSECRERRDRAGFELVVHADRACARRHVSSSSSAHALGAALVLLLAALVPRRAASPTCRLVVAARDRAARRPALARARRAVARADRARGHARATGGVRPPLACARRVSPPIARLLLAPREVDARRDPEARGIRPRRLGARPPPSRRATGSCPRGRLDRDSGRARVVSDLERRSSMELGQVAGARRPRSSTRSSGPSSASATRSSSCCSACSPTGTCCSRTSRAPARRCSRRRWRTLSTARFARIQFTPDLMPSDVTGSSIWNQRDADFEFRPGPIFTNLLLADEINRAPPKTQAALLEAMQERQVTIEGVTHPLEPAVPRARDAEPDRVRGHLPAARGAARPLPAAHRLRLSVLGRRVGAAGAAPRPAGRRGRAPACRRPHHAPRDAARGRGRPRRRERRPLHRRPRRGDARRPSVVRRRRARAAVLALLKLARLPGRARGPRLRHAGRRQERRRPRARPPPRPPPRALGATPYGRGRRARGPRRVVRRPPPRA